MCDSRVSRNVRNTQRIRNWTIMLTIDDADNVISIKTNAGGVGLDSVVYAKLVCESVSDAFEWVHRTRNHVDGYRNHADVTKVRIQL